MARGARVNAWLRRLLVVSRSPALTPGGFRGQCPTFLHARARWLQARPPCERSALGFEPRGPGRAARVPSAGRDARVELGHGFGGSGPRSLDGTAVESGQAGRGFRTLGERASPAGEHRLAPHLRARPPHREGSHVRRGEQFRPQGERDPRTLSRGGARCGAGIAWRSHRSGRRGPSESPVLPPAFRRTERQHRGLQPGARHPDSRPRRGRVRLGLAGAGSVLRLRPRVAPGRGLELRRAERGGASVAELSLARAGAATRRGDASRERGERALEFGASP